MDFKNRLVSTFYRAFTKILGASFRRIRYLVGLSLALVTLGGCVPAKFDPNINYENLIGSPLSSSTQLLKSVTNLKQNILLFDRTSRKVHLIDSDLTEHKGVFSVENPNLEHYLVYEDGKNYFLDISKLHISTISLNGLSSKSNLKFVGQPVSVAYAPEKDFVVFYDDYQTLTFMKLDPQGNVIDSFQRGAFYEGWVIQAGDILPDGRLLVSVKGKKDANGNPIDSLQIIDLEKSLENSKKSTSGDFKLDYQSIDMTVHNISWVAPIPKKANQVLLKTDSEIVLFNLDTKVSKSVTIDSWFVEKLSKSFDPHVVLRKSSDGFNTKLDNIERRLVFSNNDEIEERRSTRSHHFIISSVLNIDENYWDVTQAAIVSELYLFNIYNTYASGRSFARFRLSDLMALTELDIDDRAIIEMNQHYIFSLFPSDLGFITRTDIESQSVKTLKNFNIRHLKN